MLIDKINDNFNIVIRFDYNESYMSLNYYNPIIISDSIKKLIVNVLSLISLSCLNTTLYDLNRIMTVEIINFVYKRKSNGDLKFKYKSNEILKLGKNKNIVDINDIKNYSIWGVGYNIENLQTLYSTRLYDILNEVYLINDIILKSFSDSDISNSLNFTNGIKKICKIIN